MATKLNTSGVFEDFLRKKIDSHQWIHCEFRWIDVNKLH